MNIWFSNLTSGYKSKERNSLSWKDNCVPMVTAILFTIIKTWKPTKSWQINTEIVVELVFCFIYFKGHKLVSFVIFICIFCCVVNLSILKNMPFGHFCFLLSALLIQLFLLYSCLISVFKLMRGSFKIPHGGETCIMTYSAWRKEGRQKIKNKIIWF